jgi:D-glycero-alpha-D-manno-heptose-7-phosphate kinase
MQVNNLVETGSVRVDLVGGTLDIHPIQLILPEVVTINVATSLVAKAFIEKTDSDLLEIHSNDYDKDYRFTRDEMMLFDNEFSDHFHEMKFICLILKSFEVFSGVKLTLQSGSPAGAGLGGSSAMGITLAKALNRFCKTNLTQTELFKRVQAIECRILNQGVAGYQDYWPALKGGVLAIHPHFQDVRVEQLYSSDLVQFLETHMTLVYSGQTRQSGINNWEVYKGFFDGNVQMRQGLLDIAKISQRVYQALSVKDYQQVLAGIAQEGEARAKLFPNITTDAIKKFYAELCSRVPTIAGLKMCGAGGGGCFLILHAGHAKQDVVNYVKNHAYMKLLEFKIVAPL